MVEKDLSAREKKILASLIKANDYITAAELSKILNVSEKTIYRDLQSITTK
jgi:transcriptional antiterminator